MDNKLKLTDLISVKTLQRIQDSFAKMARMATLITDENGTALTNGSNFSEYCTEYCRKSPIGKKRCEQCDKMGAVAVLESKQPYSYYCHANLVDFGAPIMLGDRMIGSFIGGQVLTEEPDLEKMRRIAKEIEVDEEGFIEAAKKIQIIPKSAVERSTQFIFEFAKIISDMAYQSYKSRQLSEEAMQATRMKSDFLANMSHEIRTPMNAILGMAEMALREEMNSSAREYIHQIKSSGKNLLVIINDILDFSKIESGKMDIIEVDYEPFSLINDIASIVNSRIGEKDVEYIMDIPMDIPCRLIGDNIRIQQILINLLNNAVKFTKRGKITLKLDFVSINDDEVLFKAAVSDTGMGIKKQDIGKLFKSFQQVDSKRNRNIEGTGLGLAITQQLVTLMNGRVSVESEYEKGSTFFIELPQKICGERFKVDIPEKEINAVFYIENEYIKEQLKKDLSAVNVNYSDIASKKDASEIRADYFIAERQFFNEKMLEFASAHTEIIFIVLEEYNCTDRIKLPNVRNIRKPAYSLKLYAAMGLCPEINRSEKAQEQDFVFIAPEASVLVVDDNQINLAVAKGLLEPLKMDVELASSAAETISKVHQKKYDIIFMDHMMPEVDGVETTHIIRRLIPSYADVPIIALTANAVGGTREMFLQEGMNDFVAKPIDVKEMIAKLLKWLPANKIIPVDEQAPANTEKQQHEIIIEGLNTKLALSLIGDEDLFWTVLEKYYRAIDKKAAIIREYWKSGDIENYTIEVHSLKSTSKQVGSEYVSDIAARLEQAGNENDVKFIDQHTERLLSEFLKYKEYLAPYFPDVKAANIKKKASEDDTFDLLDKMTAALDEMDTLVIDEVMEEFDAYEFDAAQNSFLEKLKKASEVFDIDLCVDIVDEWKQSLI